MSLFTFRVSKTEAAVFGGLLALALAYDQYQALDRQARSQASIARELHRLNQHIEDRRDLDSNDDFELSHTGCPCA